MGEKCERSPHEKRGQESRKKDRKGRERMQNFNL